MIIHVDMDAFYASVEEREAPELRGRPMVVAGSATGRGVVSAANYPSRAFGIHSAMPTATAIRLCRDLIVLPVRMALYVSVSEHIREIFNRFTPLVEPLSLDEAFLDTRNSERLHGPPQVVARKIKDAIRDELSLVASVGVAPNKFLAKLASDHDKPDGFTVVHENNIQGFLDPLPVTRLWGVGKSTADKLLRYGIRTVGELRQLSIEELSAQVGRHGSHLHDLAHGRDDRAVIPEHESRSISHETTFAEDIVDPIALEGALMRLTESVCCRVRANGLKGRTVTLKLRDRQFRTTTASETLTEQVDSTQRVWSVACKLLHTRLKPGMHVRLIGIGLSRFDTMVANQIDLFSSVTNEHEQRIDSLTDEIQKRYGKGTIGRATRLFKDSQ
ncbi:MAG: DNA polymerase IV [marine bacterium B5-7]|nr:MAG: DNA polymerase IV [marine bacterium B5-7]